MFWTRLTNCATAPASASPPRPTARASASSAVSARFFDRGLARRQQAAAHVLNPPGSAADQVNTNGIQVGTVLHITGKIFRRVRAQSGPPANNVSHGLRL